MQHLCVSAIESLVEQHLSDGHVDCTWVGEDAERALHPRAVIFQSDSPTSSFRGFTPHPLYETNLLLGELDDDRKHRIERVGSILLYTYFEVSSGLGTVHVVGQALECDIGSADETSFVQNALAQVMEDAREPLEGAMRAARDAGLALAPAAQDALKKAVFG